MDDARWYELGVARQPVKRVAVVGTGVIGSSWAACFLARGLDVIDSPLAHRLKAVAGPDCYIKFAAHSYALPMGLRRPLATVSQRKAWRFLNEVDADLIREFHDALEAGLAARA